MTLGDVVYYSFTICNTLRLVSYLPQIHKVMRDTNGASAISYSTWILWLAANATTAVYSVYNLGDGTMAWTNALNALCCAIVIMLTALKRRQFHAQITNYRGQR
jgi:uncharacterized protein with PQ loop repeat